MFGHQGQGSSNSSNLVEFRAGRMNMIGRMVHADARKGLVYLTQSDDGLMHFCWKDRTSGKIEDDLIVFPEEYEFLRVEQCKTGRVYVLKFKTSSRRMFFWLQEPKSDKDDEYCHRVNELMNNPPSGSRGGGGGNSDGGDLHYMLNNMSQQQLMQLFGGVGQIGGLNSLLGSLNRPSENSRNNNGNNRNNSNLLASENNSNNTRTNAVPKSVVNKPNGSDVNVARTLNIDLSTAIASGGAIDQIFDNSTKIQTLSVCLPESYDSDDKKKQQIKETLNSPQFQQALSLFSNALQSAQLGPVVSQFELNSDAVAAAYAGNLEDFVKALEKASPSGVGSTKSTNGMVEESKTPEKHETQSATDQPDEQKKPTE